MPARSESIRSAAEKPTSRHPSLYALRELKRARLRCRASRWPRRRSGQRLFPRSEEHTSELQSHVNLVCRLLLEKKKMPLSRYIFLRTITVVEHLVLGLHLVETHSCYLAYSRQAF